MVLKHKKMRWWLAAGLGVAILVSLVVFFLVRQEKRDRIESSQTLNQDLLPPFPVRELDKIYIYKDSEGKILVSEKPPEGVDYQVVDVPRSVEDPEVRQRRVDMANQARKIMRGQGEGDGSPEDRPEQDDREQPGATSLSGASAGDILSRSNALRKKAARPEK